MKSYKDLREKLLEYTGDGAIMTHGSEQDSLGSGSYSVHQLQRPEALEAINHYLGNITKYACFNPNQAIGKLKMNLNKLGLDFDHHLQGTGSQGSSDGGTPTSSMGEGTYKLTQFGGTFGKNFQTPIDQFETTDGISDKLGHGLNLEVTYMSMQDGLTKVNARIVPDNE